MALLAVAMACCNAASAKVVFVDGAKTTSGNGASWAGSYQYLRDALANSRINDEIWVAKGTYFPDDTIGIDQEIIFGDREISFEIKGQKVYGGFIGTEVNLSDRNPVANPTILTGKIWTPDLLGDYSSLHVTLVEESSTLDGLTIQDGNANGSVSWVQPRIPKYDQGGACYVTKDKVLTLQGCTIKGNRAVQFGGAIMIEDGASGSSAGKVVATNCVFDQNTITPAPLGPKACEGGAIFGNVTAKNCTFSANKINSGTDANGGAVRGDVDATNCVFTGNTVTANIGLAPDASGGAIFGDVTGLNSTFTGNQSTALRSYAGAIRGAINAANFVFSANSATRGTTDDIAKGTGLGGGGAIYTEDGVSVLINCVFVKNTSGIRGGAIVAGPNDAASSLLIADSTFLDNGVATGLNLRGAAVTCMSAVRIANNIFWNTGAIVGGFDQDKMVSVTDKGLLRNTYDNYPVPVDHARNVVKLGALAFTSFQGADVYLGATAETLIVGDPLFFDLVDPDGVDNLWRTADDGLRLKAGSSAIATTNTIINRGREIPYRNFLTADTLDIDGDGDLAELIPADIAGFARKQNILVPLLPALPILKPYLDAGAYEYGDLLNAPDISVEYPAATVLVDGAATVDLSALASVATTFVIKNTGGSDLKNLVITGDGVNISDFKFTQPVTNVVASGSSTTFTVTFVPTVDGPRSAAIHIASNDAEENPFDINLTGLAQLPNIAVESPVGTPLVDAVSTIDYGNIGLGSNKVRTFTIKNEGLGNLSITGISITGTNAARFVATAPALTFLTAGQSTTFDLTCAPTTAGGQIAALTIKSTDPDAESSFLLNLKANGVGSPEIAVRQPFSPELADGEIVDFDSVEISSTYSKEFIIKNTGTATLKNISVSLTGSSTFTATVFPVTSLAAGASKSFTVTFKPGSLGKKSAALQIKSNDFNESQIDISLVGNGISKSSKKKSNQSLAAAWASSSPKQAAEWLSSQTGQAITVTTTSDGAKYLLLTVQKTPRSAPSEKDVEVSSNLVEWFSGSKHTTVLLENESILQVRDNTPIKSGVKRYIRLK